VRAISPAVARIGLAALTAMALWRRSAACSLVETLCLGVASLAAARTAPSSFLAQSSSNLSQKTFAHKECSANPGCGDLGGDCCPSSTGAMLACCFNNSHEPRAPPSRSLPLTMEASCDHLNVGSPNCGDDARCKGEFSKSGSTHILNATSEHCAYVTFKTGLSLSDVLQLDADTFITPGTCSRLDNLGFWFFQTVDRGAVLEQPTTHWDAFSEVDLFESYIGPGGVNSINTNFAATGIHRQWNNFTVTGGMRQHVTMWQDTENTQGCPATRSSALLTGLTTLKYGMELPVVSVYVAHCAPGASCCTGAECKRLQADPQTARGCITVKDAPILLALSNWGAGHHATAGCEIGVSDVMVRTK